MSKENLKAKLKQKLIDLIYTPDAKPRFHNDNWIGGSVNKKLKRIDDAVDEIHELFQPTKFDKAYEYLVQSDEDEDLPVEAQVLAIVNQSKVDDSTMVDFVDGVQVTELFENTFTCKDFLETINW